jgi:hypothetical protein
LVFTAKSWLGAAVELTDTLGSCGGLATGNFGFAAGSAIAAGLGSSTVAGGGASDVGIVGAGFETGAVGGSSETGAVGGGSGI